MRKKHSSVSVPRSESSQKVLNVSLSKSARVGGINGINIRKTQEARKQDRIHTIELIIRVPDPVPGVVHMVSSLNPENRRIRLDKGSAEDVTHSPLTSILDTSTRISRECVSDNSHSIFLLSALLKFKCCSQSHNAYATKRDLLSWKKNRLNDTHTSTQDDDFEIFTFFRRGLTRRF
jgi:hypothetical protein